jgi:hypothetical protein
MFLNKTYVIVLLCTEQLNDISITDCRAKATQVTDVAACVLDTFVSRGTKRPNPVAFMP